MKQDSEIEKLQALEPHRTDFHSQVIYFFVMWLETN